MNDDKTLYVLNASQDVVNLQTKYSLFRRVANILFSITFDEPLDRALMKKAIDLLIERNDCLRITFVKKGKTLMQRFESERHLGAIPEKDFRTPAKMEAFMLAFRKKEVSVLKGRSLEVVFAKNPDRKDTVIFKISHFVADTYGISTLVTDLMGIYNALRDGQPLPAAPGPFEAVIAKDQDYRNDTEAFKKDREFFEEFYTRRHPDHPSYCGIHGNGSDRWLKYKAKGMFSLPYLFIKCDTEGYRFVLDKPFVDVVLKWCESNGFTPSAFFFYTYAIAASLLNDRAKYQIPLELINNRGTLAERKAAGTKVQALGLYTVVDYEKSFMENIELFANDQNELYRHTKMTYLEIEEIEHKFWNYSMLSQMTNFSFSFIPFKSPEGISLQIHSNGKGALVAYIAMMLDVRTGEISVNYDIQTKMISPQQLVEYQNLCLQVITRVISSPDKKLSEIL